MDTLFHNMLLLMLDDLTLEAVKTNWLIDVYRNFWNYAVKRFMISGIWNLNILFALTAQFILWKKNDQFVV